MSTVSADSDGSITLSGGWYYLDQSKNVSASISLSGSEDIHLILGDGYELLTPMIQSEQDSTASLTIYAQSSGNSVGKITLEGDSLSCDMTVTGDITINGGDITVSGDAAMITSNGDITINNGNISLSNQNGGPAYIQSQGSSVTINGGQITVNSQYQQSGIICGNNGTITLGYTNADDFIQAAHYLAGSSATTPIIASEDIFVDDSNNKYSGTLAAGSIDGKKLVPLSITVKFEANNGTGTMSDQTIVYGIPKTLTENAFNRDDYIFENWNTGTNGDGDSYEDKEEIKCESNDVGKTLTLYAQWLRPITYILNGGTNSSSNP